MKLITDLRNALHVHKPTILTSGGVAGVLTTAYLTGRASWIGAELIMRVEEDRDLTQHPLTTFERFKMVGALYIPAGVSGALTIASIVGANQVSANRAAAAGTAYALTERAFEDYKAKVAEQFGAKKEQGVRDAVAQDRVAASVGSQLVVVDDGKVLCYEMYTGRYFQSDMESLRRAMNDLNFELMNGCHYVSLNSWYHMIGLTGTGGGDDLGWDTDRLMELKFSATLSDDGKPCIAFDYNYVKAV